MAGKFSKVLVGAAVAGAAVAGGLAYFLKKKEKENSWDEDLENFDDHMTSEETEEDEVEDVPVSREYVTIPHSSEEVSEDSEEEEEISFAEEPETKTTPKNDIPTES